MIITFKATMHKNTKNFSNGELLDRVHYNRINKISWIRAVEYKLLGLSEVDDHSVSNSVSVSNAEKIDKKQESRAVARKPRDAAAVLFGLKYVRRQHSLQV